MKSISAARTEMGTEVILMRCCNRERGGITSPEACIIKAVDFTLGCSPRCHDNYLRPWSHQPISYLMSPDGGSKEVYKSVKRMSFNTLIRIEPPAHRMKLLGSKPPKFNVEALATWNIHLQSLA